MAFPRPNEGGSVFLTESWSGSMDSMGDLEVKEWSGDKKNKTLLEDIVTTQHTRRTTLSHQNSAQESKKGNDFATKLTDWPESLYALGILTLYPTRLYGFSTQGLFFRTQKDRTAWRNLGKRDPNFWNQKCEQFGKFSNCSNFTNTWAISKSPEVLEQQKFSLSFYTTKKF